MMTLQGMPEVTPVNELRLSNLKRDTPPICIKLSIVRNPVILLNGRATLSFSPEKSAIYLFHFLLQ